jgi:hypothetical protein
MLKRCAIAAAALLALAAFAVLAGPSDMVPRGGGAMVPTGAPPSGGPSQPTDPATMLLLKIL